MYVNKCTKCGAEFETKNPKRVICPSCLYPDRQDLSLSSYNNILKQPEETPERRPEQSPEQFQQNRPAVISLVADILLEEIKITTSSKEDLIRNKAVKVVMVADIRDNDRSRADSRDTADRVADSEDRSKADSRDRAVDSEDHSRADSGTGRSRWRIQKTTARRIPRTGRWIQKTARRRI